jgi:uncharacterized protein DUF1629
VVDYFLLSAEIDDSGEVFTALDSSGTSLWTTTHLDPAKVSQVYLKITKRSKLNDLAPSIGNELILSKNASAALVDGVRFCSFMRSVPALFYRRTLNEVVDDKYIFWWSLKPHPVLDIDASSIRFYKHHILTVNKWVLRRDLVPDCDIFLGPTDKWLVSSIFKNACLEGKLTGFCFEPVEAH